MSAGFDAYHTWLGIPPAEQPPHYYRLLGIPLFEANAAVIENAAEQRMVHVRSFQNGARAAESQKLMNALARAHACLSNPEKKGQYDLQLQSRLASLTHPAAMNPAASGVLLAGGAPQPLKVAQSLLAPPIVPAGPPVMPPSAVAAKAPANGSAEPASVFTRFWPHMAVGGILGLVILLGGGYLISRSISGRQVAIKPGPPTAPPAPPPLAPQPQEQPRVPAAAAPSPAVASNGPVTNIPAARNPGEDVSPPSPSLPVEPPAALRTEGRNATIDMSAIRKPSGDTNAAGTVALGDKPKPKNYSLRLGIAYDLMAKVDPTKATSGGIWKRDASTWQTQAGDAHTVLELALPYGQTLPREYLLEATVTRVSGSDISFGLMVGGNPCELVIDGYQAEGTYSGLDLVQGKTLDQIGPPHAHRGRILSDLKRSKIFCAVLKDRVWATVDGQEICNFTGDVSTLSRHPLIPLTSRGSLSLSTFHSSYRIHELKVTSVLDSWPADSAPPIQFAGTNNPAPTAAISNAPVSSGAGATNSGNPVVQPGAFESGTFLGNYYVVIKTSEEIVRPGANFTLEAWTRPEFEPLFMSLFSTTHFEVTLEHRTSDRFRTVKLAYHGAPEAEQLTYAMIMNPTSLLHVAVVGDNNTESLYVNGRKVGSRRTTNFAAARTAPSTQVSFGQPNGQYQAFRGEVLQVRVSDTPRYAGTAVTVMNPLPADNFTRSLLENSPRTYGKLLNFSRRSSFDWRRITSSSSGGIGRVTDSRPGGFPALPANDFDESMPPGGRVQPKTLINPITGDPEPRASLPKNRLPLPQEEERTKARAKVEQTFGENIAKATKPEEKLTLANTLLRIAATEKDAAVNFALLVEARQLAVAAGNVEAAWEATRTFANTFDVSPLDASASTVRALKDKTLPPAERDLLLERTLDLTKECVTAEKWDLADGMAQIALGLTANLRDQAKKKEVKLLRDDVAENKADFDAVDGSLKKLETNPKDGDANLAVGKYYCLKRENWKKGLSYLAMGSDPALATEATKELKIDPNSAEAPTAQLASADGWYDLQQKFKGDEKTSVQRHVVAKYELLAPGLSGLNKARIDNRITELNETLEKVESGAAARSRTAAQNTRPQPNFLPGAILRVFLTTSNGRSGATPFLGVVNSRTEIQNLRVSEALVEKRAVYSSLTYALCGEIILPADTNVQIMLRYCKGQLGTTPLVSNSSSSSSSSVTRSPYGGSNSSYSTMFDRTVPLKKGAYRVLLQSTGSEAPDFYFRDSQGNSVLFYADQELAAEMEKTAAVPLQSSTLQLKGILLPAFRP